MKNREYWGIRMDSPGGCPFLRGGGRERRRERAPALQGVEVFINAVVDGGGIPPVAARHPPL